jgi:hypothetical protein
MVLKRQLVCATIAVAALAVACNDTPGSSVLSPTGPSAPRPSPADTSASNGLSAEQTAALAEACRFGSGTVVVSPGSGTPPPPPAGSPGTTPPSSGTSPGGSAGPAAPETNAALGGALESRTGSCPAITFVLNGKTVRTDAETSFGGGSCASIEHGNLVGVIGTVQGDGSIAASCVAPGV